MRGKILLPFFFSLIFFSGCITIHEKFQFNRNGSGTMEYIIDMNELYKLMQVLSESESAESIHIDQTFLEAAEALKKVRGISNIRLTGNSREYIFGIKYDFANINALNDAMALILQSENQGNKYISFSRRNITRYSIISDEFSQGGLFGVDNEEYDPVRMNEIFEQMKYNVSMSFHRSVRSVDSKAEYSINKNEVSFTSSFAKLIESAGSLKTTINLR